MIVRDSGFCIANWLLSSEHPNHLQIKKVPLVKSREVLSYSSALIQKLFQAHLRQGRVNAGLEFAEW